MEASVVFRPLPCFSAAGIDSHSPSFPSFSGFPDFGNQFLSGDLRISGSRAKAPRNLSGSRCSGFCHNGHVEYYCGSTSPAIRCTSGKTGEAQSKKKIKKKLKLLKGLSKDLSVFSDMRFGLDPLNNGLIDQVKGKMIWEATDVLLGQLEQLKAEEKELKKKKKEEKAKARASRMQNRLYLEASSGSSSDSSDIECGEVIDMSRLKSAALRPPAQEPTRSNLLSSQTQEEIKTESQTLAQEAIVLSASSSTRTQLGERIGEEGTLCNSENFGVLAEKASPEKMIEVCMGGKCKKSGAAALVEEFRRALGGESGAAVVGCKCMGKCRDGPNVRVSSNCDHSLGNQTSNPLCIGVGIDDVGLIVANLLGEAQKDMGLAPAAS